MAQTSTITLSKSALKTNVDFIQKLLGSTQFSSVVKGNAYGHGIRQFCTMMIEIGVNHFSVFSANEAMEIKALFQDKVDVLVMGYISSEDLEWVIANNVSFFVFEMERLKESVHKAKKLNKPAKIHLEIETGMNRTGCDKKEWKTLMDFVSSHQKWLHTEGVCSHLAGAESIANFKRIKGQIKTFNTIQEKMKKNKDINPIFHLACSAAALQYPKTRLSMARIGILQYGFFPSNEVLVQYFTKYNTQENPLKRIISWKTQVMDTNKVMAGKFVGYGNSFFTNSETKVALIPVGYAHGFSRSLSNQGKVLIRGKRLDVIGIVNMNMTAIDITECPQIRKGDEVVLIGSQGDLEITVTSFGDFSNLLNYELLTRLPSDIERKIIA
jgi:alanine racemase